MQSLYFYDHIQNTVLAFIANKILIFAKIWFAAFLITFSISLFNITKTNFFFFSFFKNFNYGDKIR